MQDDPPAAAGPFTSTALRTEVVALHGHRLSYQVGGTSGPVLLFLHGLLGSSGSFGPALAELAGAHRVIAPDLLGHGASEKPAGDYSLGSFATMVRDLLVLLDVAEVTVVGHSLGGGVALQFAHQFPACVERVVLVDSGGLGRDVTRALRAVTLPGAEYVLPALFNRWTWGAVDRVAAPMRRFTPPGVEQVLAGLATLADGEARTAFVHTARGVLDAGGQRVSAVDRMYLAGGMPLLLVWGGRDAVIPVRHAEALHERLPGSRLVVFPDSGHFPQVDDPGRFAAVLADFVATTTPPADRDAVWRAALRAGSPAPPDPA